MLSKRVVLVAVALSLLFFMAPLAVNAQQVSSGTVAGTVTDPSGAVIVGADVSLTDITTHASRKLVTNADGRYFFVNIPPGTYDLTVGKTGFRSEKVSKQEVTVGLTLTLNLKLQVGVATEVVEVQAGTGAELQTLNSTVGTAFSGVSLDSLPAFGRDASTFVTLQPGMSPGGDTAGAVMDQNTFQLDGGQNTNDMDGSMNIYTPSFANDPSGVTGGGPTGVMPTPIDSIEEFKIGTTQQTADFNSSAGAQVSMISRRGHDAWHGTAYEYYQDNLLNANSFTNNAPDSRAALPDYHYSRFGGAGGGPIVPKKILGGKTYFFGNYEGFRFPNSETVTRDTPGPGMRLGLLAGSVCTSMCVPGPGVIPVFSPAVFNLQPAAVAYTGPTLGALTTGTTYAPGETISGVAQASCFATIVACDPRGLGISPTIQALWSTLPAATTGFGLGCGGNCDGVNVLALHDGLTLPTRSDFALARIDHDFGDKEHFFASYRFYHLDRATDNQTLLSATNTLTATSNRPQVPWFLVAGLTSNITSNFTNDLHYSYLRNWWLWGTLGGPPQTCGGSANCTGLGAALEPGGETADPLAPYNVNTQSVRNRYWDGQDNMLRDDMTRVLGNHLLQWGGIYQHNYNQHSRTDNGGGINDFPTYILGTLGTGNGTNMTGYTPGTAAVSGYLGGSGTGTGITSNLHWNNLYGDTLGMLAQDQIVYTRSGPQLTLNVTPPGAAPAPVTDRVHIPYYNVYFTDSWKIKPTVTLTYGLAWTLEMPPVEQNGEQVEVVDAANQVLNVQQYLNTRKAEALQGVSYNPEIGFSLVGNAAGGLKYPYNPYYGEFSPRLAVAWSPNFDNGILGDVVGRGKTVVRGGFSIIFGRLNGVDLVLVPLLGTGLLQPVQCIAPQMSGACGTTTTTNPANSFRVGPTAGGWDGLVGPLAAASPTLPQPYFPGISTVTFPPTSCATPPCTKIAPEAGASEGLDQNFRPNKSYEMNFTIQRQISSKFIVEAGYIGRIIRNEYMPIDLNSVPYMYTLGGQSFAKAYGQLTMQYCGGNKGLAGGNCAGDLAAVTPQPFFEKALGGAASAYCTAGGATSCTQAVAMQEGNNGTGNLSGQLAFSLWRDLDSGPFVFPNTLESTGAAPQLSSGVADNASIGYGNYNALFISTRMNDWHGLTMQSNFTWGKALGVGALDQASSEYTATDSYFIGRGYGPQTFDRKFLYNMFLVYQPPFYKSQHGVIGHVLGGWTVAPIFVTGSGLPLPVFDNATNSSPYNGGEEFGAGCCVAYGSLANSVDIGGPGCSGFSTTSHFISTTSSSYMAGFGTNEYQRNLYSNPMAVANCFRNPVLGIDTGANGGAGASMRGQPFWNVDIQVRKTTNITERISGEFQVVVANMFNHVQLADPFNCICGDPGDFGNNESQANSPRSFEFGFRVRF